MNPRYLAIQEIGKREKRSLSKSRKAVSEEFGSLTFHKEIMQRMLPAPVYQNVLRAISGKEKLNPSDADAVALAMKDWAMGFGATHYCHWFQPMTGVPAEKHDAFIDWKTADTLIESFSGKQLLRGEPDASSFPSGGLRRTSEARGYTAWDPTSYAFLWRMGERTILCIPSVFFSWKGEALDMKIPLLRSDAKINQAALRLMRLCGIPANHVFSTLGCEQEYFLVDRSLYLLRPDLVMTGRTVCGAASPKSQELEDHYFRTIKERVLVFMQDFEDAAWELGIPLKTRHNEVAPGQFEVAPIFERASLAVDHNALLMELMRQIAAKHDFACLLHEKPFAGINGSGKHNNWSLATDSGFNLLDPKGYQGDPLAFFLLVSAVLTAVHRHSALLYASVASPANDHRLGGNEAPPAIISIYLGRAFEEILEHIEKNAAPPKGFEESIALGVPSLPELPKDRSDRNRTSPFAFTGNKFEFRSVGASHHCAFPIAILNSIVAESLERILNEVEANLNKKGSVEEVRKAAAPVLAKYLKASKNIRFIGDNYTKEWRAEAKKRKLPILAQSYLAYDILKEPSSKKVLQGVFSEAELTSRFEILVHHYVTVIGIEAKVLLELSKTLLLPAAQECQKQMAKSLRVLGEVSKFKPKQQHKALEGLAKQIEKAFHELGMLEKQLQVALLAHGKKGGDLFCHKVVPQMAALRKAVDQLETIVDDRLWPLPKYREMLHLL